jgi:hypothetical protein
MAARTKQAIIVLLLALASSADADSNSLQIEHLRSEIEQLKAENALLIAKTARMEQLCPIAAAQVDTMSELELHERDDDEVKQTEATQMRTAEAGLSPYSPETGTCPEKCQGKCELELYNFDKNCVMTEATLKVQTATDMIKPVGTAENPEWELRSGGKNKGQSTLLGRVACPCKTSAGKALTKEEAVRAIVGQVASLRFPWAPAVCDKRKRGKISQMEALWNTKVTLATVKMLHCWQVKCSIPNNLDTAMDLQDLLPNTPKGRYVDLELSDKFGGGTEC